jgi:hypothetical protein
MLQYIPQSIQFLNRSRLLSKYSAVYNFRALNYVVLVFIPLVNLVYVSCCYYQVYEIKKRHVRMVPATQQL